jgi:hypothetical protein
LSDTMYCKYHPGRETKVSCSSCGEGLCPDCMVYSPVGIKCKDCARPNKGMLRKGKPSQYAGAIVAGILSSVIGGMILMNIFRGSFLLNIALGFLIGEAVRRGAGGNRGPAFAVIAGGSAFLGLLIAGYALTPIGLVFTLIVSGVAAYRLSS